MSGQPNRYANSAEKFRNEYMDALNIRANVDEVNLQANKNYKATGTLPPNVKAMVDNRTTTEILADSEKLKLNIISELKPVMNSGTASVVVQKIQTAPINADGSFLIWVAQNIPEIVKSLKKKYALGIKGDAQDATNIVIFLTDMYSKIKDYSGTVKSYFDTVGESKTGLKEGDLDALRKEYELIVARLKTKFPNFRDTRYGQFKINNLITKTTDKINNMFELLSSSNYKSLVSRMAKASTSSLLEVNGISDLSKAIFDFLDNLPSVSLVRALYTQLDKSIENQNPELSYSILNEIYNIFPDGSKMENIVIAIDANETERLQDIPMVNDDLVPFGVFDPDAKYDSSNVEKISVQYRNDIENKIKGALDTFKSPEFYQMLLTLDAQSKKAIEDKHSRLEYFKDELSDLRRAYNALERQLNTGYGNKRMRQQIQVNMQQISSRYDKIETEYNKIADYFNKYNLPLKVGLDQTLSEVTPGISNPLIAPDTPEEITRQGTQNKSESDRKNSIEKRMREIDNLVLKYDDDIEAIDKQIENYMSDPSRANYSINNSQVKIMKQKQDEIINKQEIIVEEYGALDAELNSINGSGLKKRRGRPKGSGISFKDNIDHAKGIQPVKKYHPFGKYFVNSHKLNNGSVLSIKSKSGTNVREYPSKTVSRNLGHVIKTIVGGGVPSWNDMEKLSNDEKDYLYKISKRAEFSDKITIPTPSKDQQEKDIHEFDVCKGEIMAGNDSKELIKKFKLLIIKLSKNGSIPKREASEVMQELLELGY